MSVKPLEDSIKAKMHDSVYTVHRYFARRPCNVISNVISHYAAEDNMLIFDPFGGGGTMLVESLSQGHRAVACDTSDLACFVMEQEALMASADEDRLSAWVEQLLRGLVHTFGSLYRFEQKEVYWISWTSFTACPACEKATYLSPDQSAGNGNYICMRCGNKFRPVRVHNTRIEPLGICTMEQGSFLRGKVINPQVHEIDVATLRQYYQTLLANLEQAGFSAAMEGRTPIPDCNLQRESALHSKGFLYFEQFIPKATRAVVDYIGRTVMNSELPDADKKRILFVLSASLRYCSRFSSLNPSWRGNTRPLEWAKSNFWTPYSYVEVNPIVAFHERWNSYLSGVKSAKAKMRHNPVQGTPADVVLSNAHFAVCNHSSEQIPLLPDASVDLIVTDPPYGSYLHYGELSAFWTTWLSRFLPEISPVPDREREAVPARKKGYPGWKTFDEYQAILVQVFRECYRVLKQERFCVVTFNNKEPEAWLSFLRAVKQAGFALPKNGVIFQDGVESYKNTIDSRRDGAIFGDFIYSFQKTNQLPAVIAGFSWRDEVVSSLKSIVEAGIPISNADLYTTIYLSMLPKLFASLNTTAAEESLNDLTMKNLESIIKQYLVQNGSMWISANKS